jgi:hypothetical protein
MVTYCPNYLSVVRFWGPKAGAWVKTNGTWKSGYCQEIRETRNLLNADPLQPITPYLEQADERLPPILALCKTTQELTEAYHNIDWRLGWTINPSQWFWAFDIKARALFQSELRAKIPPAIIEQTLPFPPRETWSILQWMNKIPNQQTTTKLAKAYPILAWAMANYRLFHKVSRPWDRVRRFMNIPEFPKMIHAILEDLGIAANPNNMAILQYVPHHFASRRMLETLQQNLRNPIVAKFMLHHRDQDWLWLGFAKGVSVEFMMDAISTIPPHLFEATFQSIKDCWRFTLKLHRKANIPFDVRINSVRQIRLSLHRIFRKYSRLLDHSKTVKARARALQREHTLTPIPGFDKAPLLLLPSHITQFQSFQDIVKASLLFQLNKHRQVDLIEHLATPDRGAFIVRIGLKPHIEICDFTTGPPLCLARIYLDGVSEAAPFEEEDSESELDG